MVYIPKALRKIESTEDLRKYVEEELRAISQESTEATSAELRPISSAPVRPREGMIVYAEAPWDPGYGEGLYVYSNGVWVPVSFRARAFRTCLNAAPITGVPHAAYFTIGFDAPLFDFGGGLAAASSTYRWIPRKGLVQLNAATYFGGNPAPNGAFAVAIVRNSSEHIGQGLTFGSAAGGAAVQVSVTDYSDGSKFYEAWAYYSSASGANDGVVGNGQLNTHFSGAELGMPA